MGARARAVANPSIPIGAEGPHGVIRLKWHKARTNLSQAPFRLSNLVLGWELGASLEIDIIATADGRFIVAHDATLGPSTTGRGRVASLPYSAIAGALNRDADGVPDPDAPVLLLSEFVAPLRAMVPGHGANLQLDLKASTGHPLTQAAVRDAARAVTGLEQSIVVSSYNLHEARQVAAAIRAGRLGYDPMQAVARNPALSREPERLIRHLERRRAGMAIAYLNFGLVAFIESRGVRLVQRLLDLGIETDVWTVNTASRVADNILRILIESGVRQITTDEPAEIARRIARL